MTTRDEELFELVNDKGETVGVAPRSQCHGNAAMAHRAVHVFIRNRARAIFLQKRAANKDVQPGRWDTSVGGHVVPGESYEEAAAREMEEELGIRLDDIGGVAALEPLHTYFWRSGTETEYIRTFRVESEGPFTINRTEISEGRFWSESELRGDVARGILTPNLEEELRRLRIAP